MTACMRTGCTRTASKRPVIVFARRGFADVRALLSLDTCAECAATINNADEILTGADADKLATALRSTSRHLEWIDLDSKESRDFDKVRSS